MRWWSDRLKILQQRNILNDVAVIRETRLQFSYRRIDVRIHSLINARFQMNRVLSRTVHIVRHPNIEVVRNVW